MTANEDGNKLEAAWNTMILKLLAVRGDEELETFLAEKHPELALCAVPLDASSGRSLAAPDGTSVEEARENWFARKLKGTARDSAKERRHLCKGFLKSLKRYSARYEELYAAEAPKPGGNSTGTSLPSACEALKAGGAAEGPVICAGLAAGLVGTKFEGLRICRERDGVYQLGVKPLRVAVQADLEGEELLVHGYFDGDVLHPVRAPVRAFLEEHGAAPASDQCDMFGDMAGAQAADPSASQAKPADDVQVKRLRELPPGWTKRESRSKPGVFYYVHEAKGLSQMERPA